MVMFVFVELKKHPVCLSVCGFVPHPPDQTKNYNAIEEICGKSSWRCSFRRLAAVTMIFSKKSKTGFLYKVNGTMCAKFQVCINSSMLSTEDPRFVIFFFLRSSQVRHICLHLHENGWAASWNPVRFQIAFLWKRKGWVRPDPLEEPNFRFSFFSDERERQGHSTTTLRVVF